MFRTRKFQQLHHQHPSPRAAVLVFSRPSTRCLSSSTSLPPPLTTGILRETYDSWERRAPLCPDHVKNFLAKHPTSKVLVQPSTHRIFTNADYEQAGATVQDDLSSADVIFGVKSPTRLQDLPSHATYLFFSHVIKGQPENMGLLQEVLDRHIQMIDYECIVQGGLQMTTSFKESKAKRLVAFGKYAGLAGMLDTFSIVGRRLLLQSYSTPFLNCPPAIYHASLEDAKQAVQRVGERLQADGLPPQMEPLVVCMTGKGGNVYRGVREIFDLLPHEMVSVKDLPQVLEQTGPQYKVFGVAPEMADMYQRSEDGAASASTAVFHRSDFQENPQDYTCTFADAVAPYAHVLMNCVYWDDRFPRLLTKEDMLQLYESGNERYETATNGYNVESIEIVPLYCPPRILCFEFLIG
jgi:alpha-aminoadipic semialdehyde synthase